LSFVEIHGVPIPRVAIGLAIVLGYLVVAFVLRHLLLRYIGRLAKASETQWDDVFVAALRTPLTLNVLASAGWVCMQYLLLPSGWNQRIDQITRVFLIFALFLFIDQFLRGSVALHQKRFDELNLTQGFVRLLLRLAVLVLGTLVLLDTLHISITPLLASLGVGGLAVGLALQGTLSNFFAGIQLISTRPIRVGDFIHLQSGEEGYVTEIGWRATCLRMLPNSLVVVPNARLADSVITNYDLPASEQGFTVTVGVSFDSNLEQVERVTLEVATGVQKTVQGAVPDHVPNLRFLAFESSSINFNVALRGTHFVDQYLIRHEFIKRLHARFQQEGIVIPWPIRTLDVSQETLDALAKASRSIQK
jgi:small-conductance mechanosensitive channel